MTGRSVRLLLASFFAFTFLLPSAFGQGSKMKSPYDPIEEADKDNPEKRAEWMSRGRTAPPGQSAAALRLRAHQQKMAMRAQREAAAAAQPETFGSTPPPATGWVGLGPAPLVSDSNFFGKVSGRATSVAIDPSDPTGATVYVGGAYGGVWKSTNATNADPTTVTWNPVTDQQASLATGAVSVKPDGTVVLVGTGEPNNAIDSYYGVGILRSTDKGATWALIPSADNGTHPFAGLGAAKFAWSTASTNTVVAAMATAAVGFEDGAITANTNRGLYLSTNAGQTWAYQALTDGSAPISATDVVYNATAGKFFASIRSHGIYSSTNGTNWTRLANQPNPAALTLANCPTAAVSSCPLYRGQLTVVPGRNEMYVWFVDINDNDGGIWRSTDGGATPWTQISETGIASCGDPLGCGTQQAFYNLEIYGVPNNTATDLYTGAVNLFKCTLATKQVTTCSQGNWLNLTHVYGCSSIASVHPDEHGIDFKIVGGKAIMYFANDGGVYRALDGFTGLVSGTCGNPNSFGDLNGPIGSMTQFVSFSTHPTDQNTVLGGTQDNGSPATSNATGSSQWFTANGGDGGYNAINPSNTSQWFAANTDVSIQVCNTAPNCTSAIFGNPIVSNGNVGGDFGAFYTPYILDPQKTSELLVGTCRVWRGPSTGGVLFTSLSNNFDTGGSGLCDPNVNPPTINESRSLAAGGPKDSNGFSTVVYATTEGTGPNAGLGATGGEVWVTTSAGTTQMANKTSTINPSNYTISSVAIDTSVANGQTAYVGIMGFGVGHVFKTTNAGVAWTNFTGSGLPDAPVNALLVDSSVTPAQIYAGTDVGVFVSSTTSAAWTEVGPLAQPGATGYLPNVPVSAIRLFDDKVSIRKLRVSTYGRGIWEFDLAPPAPDYQIAISDTPQTVLRNQTAIFSGTLTAVGTYSSAVTLSCGAGAPGACTFSPSGPIVPTLAGVPFTVSMPSGNAIQNYTFSIHGTDGTLIHDIPVTLNVTDFSLGVPSPGTVTAQQGGVSNATQYTLSSLGPFNGTVSLSCSGPAVASCSFSPTQVPNLNPGNPTANITTTVTALANAPLGNSTVTISAVTAGEAAKTQPLTLTVTAPPDFTWTGGGAHTVLAGQTTLAYNFTATPTGGPFATAVTFACSNLPDSTVTCAFSPTQIAAGAGATPVTLTITTKGPNPGTGTSRSQRADKHSPWLPLTLPIAGIFMVGLVGRKVSRHSALAGLCVSLGFLGLLVACGGGGSSGPPPPPPVSVTVSPGTTVSLYANEAGNAWPANLTQQQFTAVVHNSTNQTVTWAVTGEAANGTVDGTGLYTTPAVVPGNPAVTVTATAQADATKSGSGRVSILTPTILGTFPSITVTATEGVVAHSQTVSLTVQ